MSRSKASHDALAEIIANGLNKMNKDGSKVAYFLDTDSSPTDLTDFISTGSSILDLAISNRPKSGIAVGRIFEVSGLEAAGKSLLCAHMIADVQKRNGVAVLIDTENAVNEEFFASVGVDRTKLVYAPQQTVEEIFESITRIIESVRSSDKDKLTLIVVDSIAAASTEAEMEADYSKDGYATGKAIIISKALRKITQLIGRQKIALVFTNQLRMNLNAGPFADPYISSGGKALSYHASTKVRLKLIGKIKDSDDRVVGVKVEAHVTKNRLGPPHRRVEFEIYFNRGIDDNASWLSFAKDNDIVSTSGAWNKYTDASGKEYKFQSKDWAGMLADTTFREEIYNKICDKMILKYSDVNSVLDGSAKIEDAVENE